MTETTLLFHFKLILLKLDGAYITADLLNQNPAKESRVAVKKIVLTRCYKWMSF